MRLNLVAWILAVATVGTAAGAEGPRLDLSPVERAFVAKQLASGRDRVPLLLLTKRDQAAGVARKLEGVAGYVWVLDTAHDFLRVSLPIAQLQRVLGWHELTSLQMEVGHEGLTVYADPAGTAPARAKPGAPPTPFTPRDNPYTGEAATQALQFKTAHPTYDGRGV